MKWRCLLSGHDHFTSKAYGEVTEPGAWDASPYLFEREGIIVHAPPCRRCGAPNPEAFGYRHGAYWRRVR